MGRYLGGRGHGMHRKAGRHPEDRFLVMIMLGEETGSLSRLIPSAMLPARYEQRSPHITLSGPFTLAPDHCAEDIAECIGMHGIDCSPLRFEIKGLISLRGRKGDVLALEVSPDRGMKEFYTLLSGNINRVARQSTWLDRQPGLRRLHITLAFNMCAGEASRLREQIPVPLSVEGTRTAPGIAILRNGSIWCEYDLTRHQWLDRAALFAKKRPGT